MNNAIHYLARCPYFRGIPTELLHALSMHAVEQRVAPGEVIATRLDPSTAIWLIGEGLVQVRRPQGYQGQRVEVAVSTLEPGMVFGHVGMLSEQPRTATWVASGAAILLRFDKRAFDTLIQERNLPGQAFRRALILALGNQLRAVNERLNEFLADPAGEAATRRTLLEDAIKASGATHG